MAGVNVKFLTGDKTKIDTQMSLGLIDSGDIVITADTDEMIFVNPKGEKRFIGEKTQQDYVVKGASLGGLSEGTVVKAGTSLDELVSMIVQKRIPATYESPNLTLSTDKESIDTFEVGTEISIALDSHFEQKDAGVLTAHKVYKNDELLSENAEKDLSVVETLILGDESVKYFSTAAYESGEIKTDNLGDLSSEGAILKGLVESNEINLKGQRNLFYGTSVGEVSEFTSESIRALGDNILNPVEGIEFIIPVEIGQQNIIFAYPSSLKDVSQITYVEINDIKMAESFNKTLVNVEGANGYDAIEYKVYSYHMAVPVAASMTFKVAI